MTVMKRLDAVAVVGEYTPEGSTEKKKEYMNIGSGWLHPETGIINVDLKIPVGITQYTLYPAKEKNEE